MATESSEKPTRVVGIDLSKKNFTVCWAPQKGKEKLVTYSYDGSSFQAFLKELNTTDRILFEAGNQAFWFYDQVVERAEEVFVLNPSKLAIIFKSANKTDKHDATKLAYLGKSLCKDMLPLIRIPSAHVRVLRSLLTERENYKKSLTMLKNRFHAVCASKGKTRFTRSHLQSHKKRAGIMNELDAVSRRQLERLDRSMVTLEQEIKNVEKDIETELHGYDEMVLLASLPGLGLIGCASILAYLGEVDDFETADQAVSFVGLAPRVFNSGKQQHTGTISKHGNSLIRKTLIQSIWVMVRYRYGGAILNHYENVRKRRGKGRAVVAAARKMMVVIYSMLKNGELYRDYEERLYQNKLKQFHLV